MHELKRLPDHCVTVAPYPPSGPDEVAIAREVAAALRVRHVVLPQRSHRVAAEREKNRLTHYCADEHVQFLPLRDYFSDRRCEVFDGLAGDVLSQSGRLDASLHGYFVEGRFEAAAQRILGDETTIEPSLARLLTREGAVRFPRRLAASRVALEVARHAGAPNPIAGFFFFSRMRREVALAPYALLDVCRVSTPFLDGELTDLLLSLPYALVADRTLHTHTMHRRYPALAHLPFDAKRKGQDDRRGIRRSAAALLAFALEARLRGCRHARCRDSRRTRRGKRLERAHLVPFENGPAIGRRATLHRIYRTALILRSKITVRFPKGCVMFSIVLRNAASTRRYSISSHGESGWEVTMEREGEIPHHVCYHDWHRVERALAMFRLEVSDLTARGWQIVH